MSAEAAAVVVEVEGIREKVGSKKEEEKAHKAKLGRTVKVQTRKQ
jgi:hypothetical protein